jgi:hypothetical protein
MFSTPAPTRPINLRYVATKEILSMLKQIIKIYHHNL